MSQFTSTTFTTVASYTYLRKDGSMRELIDPEAMTNHDGWNIIGLSA